MGVVVVHGNSSGGFVSSRNDHTPRIHSKGCAKPSFSGRGFAPTNPKNPKPHYAGSNKWERTKGGDIAIAKSTTHNKVCRYWVQGKCNYGHNCRYLHRWFTCIHSSLTLLKQLEGGHDQAITALALPLGSDRLFTGSKDESVRVWDCHTGQCSLTVNLGGPVGCIASAGTWIFFGTPNAVKAWNSATNTSLSLDGPVGQVYALTTTHNGMLFSGNQDGNISVWRSNETATCCFEQSASFSGHSLGVISFAVGTWLYSGSMDKTIRIWDIETGQCLQTMTGHTAAVTSLVCWKDFLISCSLDETVKVWAMSESGLVEVVYTHKEEDGVLALQLIEEQAKTVLACSCNNNTLNFYDLPSFNLRARIFSKEVIRAVGTGPQGLFFTGNQAGELKVWKWSESATTTPAP